MSLLTTVQDFCRRTGLPVPATVVGSTSPDIRQIMALLEEEGDDLSQRGSWQGITFEATHTTVATEDQGAMTTSASNGFSYIKNDTIWDRTNKLPICGPMSSQDWQAVKGFGVSGPRYRYRIRGGKLLINPTPTAGYTWAFEYVSKNWIIQDDDSTYLNRFADDTDEVLLPENLFTLGLRWRYLREKGQPYSDLFNQYEEQVKNALGRDGGKRVLSMNDGPRPRGPGIFVPEGSWDL
jgi:hypothetical protein